MRGCRHAQKSIRAAVDGELGLEGRFALEDHLAGCARCRNEWEVAVRLEEALEVLPGPPLERVDLDRALGDVRASIATRPKAPLPAVFDARVPTPALRTRRLRTAAVVGLAAAAVAVVLFTRRGPATDEDRSPTPAPLASAPASSPSFEDADQEAVRAAVRSALLACFDGTTETDEALQRFDDELRPAARAGWPVLRFAERLLHDESPSVVTAALRYLGERGDAHSAGALARVVDDDELRPDAFLALGRLGAEALPVLTRLVERPDHGVAALRALVRIGGDDVAAQLAGLLERKAEGAPIVLSRAALLDGLSQSGPSALGPMLALVETGAAERGEVLSRLPLVRDGGAELARLLDDGRRPPELAYAALAVLQPREALPWLEERCGESRERERALECLAAWSGPAPCGALLRLHTAGRASLDELAEPLRVLAEHEEEGLHEFTATLVARAALEEASLWLELLFATDHAGTATSLALLALTEFLDAGERQWAALAVGELGAERGARALAVGFRDLDPKERRVRAACLMSVHALLGEDGVRRALGLGPESAQGRRSPLGGLLATLHDVDRRDRTAYGVHRVARALDPLHRSSVMSETRTSSLLP